MTHQTHVTEDAATEATDATDATELPDAMEPADQQGMDLLAAHVPLSLLLDLAEETPESQEILATERPDASELAWCAAS